MGEDQRTVGGVECLLNVLGSHVIHTDDGEVERDAVGEDQCEAEDRQHQDHVSRSIKEVHH